MSGAQPVARGPGREFRVAHHTWVIYPEHAGGQWLQICFDGPEIDGVRKRHILADTPVVAGIAAQLRLVAAALLPLEIDA